MDLPHCQKPSALLKFPGLYRCLWETNGCPRRAGRVIGAQRKHRLECGVGRRKLSRHFDALHMPSRVTKAAHLWRVLGVSRPPFPPAAQSLCPLLAANLSSDLLLASGLGARENGETWFLIANFFKHYLLWYRKFFLKSFIIVQHYIPVIFEVFLSFILTEGRELFYFIFFTALGFSLGPCVL